MATSGIHRLIEQHAATRGDSIALVEGDRALTYRELNQRANAVARGLMASGFRRGSVAVVNRPRSVELALLLLGVLKAGGAYTWLDGRADGSWPAGLSIVREEGGTEQQCLALDVGDILSAPFLSGPNLPILTRDGDVACVLRGRQGQPAVLVPHATITALQSQPVPPVAQWSDEAGALDLWLALMAGYTAVVNGDPVCAAA